MEQEPPTSELRTDDSEPIIGWFTGLLWWIVKIIKLPVDKLIGSPYPKPGATIANVRARASKADLFFGVLLVLDLLATFVIVSIRVSFSMRGFVSDLAVLFLAWRIVDIMATALRITLFDETPSGPPVSLHPSRAVVYGLMYFFESAFCFGALYSAFPGGIKAGATPTLLDAMHMSFATAFTVGYGDVVPVGGLRVVTWTQGACSMVLLILLIGRYVSSMQSIGSGKTNRRPVD